MGSAHLMQALKAVVLLLNGVKPVPDVHLIFLKILAPVDICCSRLWQFLMLLRLPLKGFGRCKACWAVSMQSCHYCTESIVQSVFTIV